ncbi:MAG: FKBP-type peptidyl-prolyl cis-trans isomerase [Gammaproteobacteria bacterium]|nr:FKBP-type peptidyl-prolyl cis-trans isomerase [Gammaproteobacteria bacterium]
MKLKIFCLAILSASLLSTGVFAANGDDQTTTETKSMQIQNDKNKQAGDAFLAQNKAKQGVVTLPSGLQYKIIKEGTGDMPSGNDLVTVNYAGRLINGTEFDSSYTRGQPATFPVSGVIPGWVEALKLMKVGSEWELYIPSSLAYGEPGAPPAIGPNETLIFKVELLDIKKPWG